MTTGNNKKNKARKQFPPGPEVDNFVVEFRKYRTTLNKKFLARKPWAPRDISTLYSFIPGTITQIFVREGDRVEEGQELMILEAMKMKNRIHAERPGVVRKIHVTEGEQVPKSKLIFEFDLD